jgi:hypothetical protein
MTRTIFIAAALALAVTLPAMPAKAQANHTFVSAAGSDSNNCASVTTPCRHFANAYAVTAANGEIEVLDPANYGALNIIGPVSIEGHGWASIAAVSGQAAITINSPGASDKINIIGVVLDGIAISTTNGIQFNSGGSLTVRDSVIRNFTNIGIAFAPTSSTPSQLFVSNTLVSDNGEFGISISPNGSGAVIGVLDHVGIENYGSTGLEVSNNTGAINLTVTDSAIADGYDGIIAVSSGGTPVNVMVRNSTVANNSNVGVGAQNTGATIRVTRSSITGNKYAWTLYGTGTPLVTSYIDNNIDGNTNNNTSPTSTASYQ